MRALAPLVGLLLAGCAGSTGMEGVPTRALAFRAHDLEGRVVTFGSLRGQVVLVTFLYTWADPALYEVPRYLQLAETHRGEPFTIVSIVLDETSETARIFKESFEIPYHLWQVEDPKRFIEESGPFGPIELVPTSFLIDREGRIVARMIGTWPPQILERAVQELLAGDRS